MEYAFFMQISRSSSSAPSILGGKVSSGIGFIFSILSAIRFVFVITTSLAFSAPRYSNSLSISSVVRRNNGGCLSLSENPSAAIMIFRNAESAGSMKCTSHVATTGLPYFSPNSTIFRLMFRMSSKEWMFSTFGESIIN